MREEVAPGLYPGMRRQRSHPVPERDAATDNEPRAARQLPNVGLLVRPAVTDLKSLFHHSVDTRKWTESYTIAQRWRTTETPLRSPNHHSMAKKAPKPPAYARLHAIIGLETAARVDEAEPP